MSKQPEQIRPLAPALGSAAWAQGYYCAVASLIRKDGLSTQATELFREGGGAEHADEQDKEEFRAYGLLPPNSVLGRTPAESAGANSDDKTT